MSNRKLLILLALLPVLLIIGIAAVDSAKNPPGGDVVIPPTATAKTYPTKLDDQNQVTVDVTPKILAEGQEAVFGVVFDTHSVALDFDLVKISKLVDDQGNIYQPISWSGGSGGHHLSGTLTFPKISNTKSVELIISGIAGVDRTFAWDL